MPFEFSEDVATAGCSSLFWGDAAVATQVVGEMRERKREIAEEKKATAFLRGKVLCLLATDPRCSVLIARRTAEPVALAEELASA